MIFRTIDVDGLSGIIGQLGVLNKSFAEITTTFTNGNGIKETLKSFSQTRSGIKGVLNSFSSGISKLDVKNISQYNKLIQEGVSSQTAWNRTMLSSSKAAQDLVESANGATVSTKALTQAQNQSTTASKAGAAALQALSVAGNMIAFWAITKGIELAVNALDNFINRAENAREALDESSSSFSTATSELEDLQSQLDETRQKMSELEEGGITLVEEGQYEELVKTNDELERTISLKKIDQGIQANQAASDAEDLYKALTRFGGDASQERVDEILGSSHESTRVLRDDKLDKDDLNELLAGYTLLDNQITEVQDKMAQYDGDTSKRAQNKIEDLQSDLSKLQDKQSEYTSLISENMSNYQQIYDTLSAYQDAGFVLTPNQEQILEKASAALDLIDSSLGNVYKTYEDLDELDKRSRITEKLQSSGLTENQSSRLANSLSEEELSYAGQINFDEVDSIQSFNNALDKVKREANKSDNAVVVDVEPTISSSVSQIATQLKPQFDELAEAYKEIFSEDGFSIDVVDNEMLENLRSAFEDIEEDVGVSFDTTELNKFFSVLTDGASTADEVQEAFNDLATAYLYSTDTMENLNDETAQAIEQQLQEMGVTNANEVVSAALAQQKLNLGVANLYAAQTGGTLATATAEEIVNFAAEQIEMGNLSQEMAQLLLQKASFNLSTINTEADINNLIALAETAGATAQTLNVLNAAKGRFGSTNSDSLDALRARKDLALGINNAPELNFDYEPVKLDFDGAYAGSKDAAGSAGKEAADEYKEQFEKELSSLQDLHDRGKITEKQYLDALRALYEKYFKDREEYIDEFKKYEDEYLRGMKDLYESVMSGIISRIDDHIDKLNDQKDAAIDALEAQKDAAISAIEAERDARKENLEQQKKQLQTQIDLIQSQIDAKQDEIDAINDAADATKRQADLEKALYEQKRAQEQRVNKVYSGQDRGFIYEADTSSIREADEAVEDAQREIRIANIEQEIKVLEKRRDAIEDQQSLIDQQLDELDEYYDKLISNTEAYYDNLIASTEAAWDEIIKGFEETKSRWEELQELEEQAEFEANLRELGLSLDDVLNMSESQFAAFKDNYLGILADIYAGNDQMISSMSDLANVDMSALPGYLEETQQYIDMLSNGIDFTNLNDSLSSTITGFEDAAKAAGILTGAITGGGGSSSEGDKGKEGEGSGGESDSSGSGDSLLGATETLKTTGVENITEFGNAFSSGEDEEGGESVAGKVMKATASIVGAVGGGGSGGKGKGKGSGGEGSAEGGADSLMGGVALQTEAALDEEAGIPAQIAKWGELDEVLDGIITKLDTIKEKLEGLSEIDFSIPGLLGGAGHFEGTETGNSYATGTKHGLPSREHNAMISEFGPEIAVYPNGTYKLFTEPSIVDLPQGTAIFNTRQTLDILKGNKHIELGGTALFDGYDISGLENMRNLVSSHAADVLSKNPAIFTDFEVPESNQTTTVNLNGGIVLEGVQDVDALAKGIVQKLPLKMMQIMNKKEYRPRR